jgi:hypothetical protein
MRMKHKRAKERIRKKRQRGRKETEKIQSSEIVTAGRIPYPVEFQFYCGYRYGSLRNISAAN